VRYLLDTTVLIDASHYREPAFSWLADALGQPDEIGVCAVVIAEFFAGLRPDERPRWAAFVGRLTYWATTREMAQQAGIYQYEYARLGRAILTPDALIAATAAAVRATLVTDNARDFPMPDVAAIRLAR
jgi:predicted nucleic acid-binding protein